MSRSIFVILLIGTLAAQPQPPAKKPSPAELRDAPTALEWADQKLKLESFLWRDFMPIAPPDGRPLVAVVSLLSADGKPLPKGLAIETVWVLHGKEVWEAAVKEVRRDGEDASRLEVVVRNGPKWRPGAEVDVVAALRGSQKDVRLLRAAKQRVQRTD